MILSPKDSAKYITEHLKYVSISEQGIENTTELILKEFKEERFSIKSWRENELNPQDCNHPSTIDWIFFADTLNFSFWSEEGKQYKVNFHGKTYSGYWSLCAAMNRALEEGFDVISPKFYSVVSLDVMKHIFRSDSEFEIPMLEERHKILIETGNCLMENFGGSFQNCVTQCENEAQKLLQLVLDNFPSYKDEAMHIDKKVSFYKRAQILIGDIWACFQGQGYGAFKDIDSLTMFADYRIPQALVHMGVLSYSEELMKRLKDGKEIKNGDREEVEIRGTTIQAVELILEKIRMKKREGKVDKHVMFNAILIDHFLWEHRRKYAEEMKTTPYHKVRCIYY